jgi:phage head maturation protease
MSKLSPRQEARRSATPRLADMGWRVNASAPLVRTGDAAVRDGEAGDGLTLDGYSTVFNSVTVIDSWEGRFKEQFLPGSMKASFRAQTPVVQFDHGRHAQIGSLPIAAPEAGYPREEVDAERAPDGGAHLIARLHQAPIFEAVREVIASGTVNGMSIRFSPTQEKWFRADGKQLKTQGEVWAELERTWYEDVPDEELLRRDITRSDVAEMGPVVWPAYTATSIGVRSLDTGDRHELVRQITAELRTDPAFAQAIAAALSSVEADDTQTTAASSARSADGGDPDAERQADDASRSKAGVRTKADDDALRIRRIL